jgi:predicted metal-dependent hydrolase
VVEGGAKDFVGRQTHGARQAALPSGALETGWPEVSVRVGPRARRVRLVISAAEGLVVVVPRGFDHSRIPDIIADKKAWIERTWERIGGAHRPQAGVAPSLPDRILLSAVDEEWYVEYRPASFGNAQVTLRPARADLCMCIEGGREDPEACRQLLRRWLARRARAALVPWVDTLSSNHGLHFERVSIRHQRTRWGSCSCRGTISLNARLLFLPADLVDYVLLHELCHTVEMNHSPRFWRMLETHCPGSVEYRKRLRTAGDYVPAWLDRPLIGS